MSDLRSALDSRHIYSIRFAPPLVISEEDLMKAVDVIRSSLQDLDKVSCAQIGTYTDILDKTSNFRHRSDISQY